MTDDAETIRALLAARDEAIGAGDARAAIATTETGAVTYDLQPPLAIGHDPDAAAAGLEAWFGTWSGPIALEMPDPMVMIAGDLAVAHGLRHLRGRSKSAGPHDSWFRDTVVFRRQPAGWRIVHEHASYPLRMDGSGLAAVDLRPE